MADTGDYGYSTVFPSEDEPALAGPHSVGNQDDPSPQFVPQELDEQTKSHMWALSHKDITPEQAVAQRQQQQAQPPAQQPAGPNIASLTGKCTAAANAAANGDWSLWEKLTNDLLTEHTPDLERPEELNVAMGGDQGTPTDMALKHAAAVQQAGTFLRERADKFFGPGGQMEMLQASEQKAYAHYRDMQSYVAYGKTPDEVDALQQAMQSKDASVRADATRQLKEAQEQAMSPGDPSRIWHNMNSYQQAQFLAGNAMSQLGMALMHVNGPTPQDQLNRLMDMDFQAQKMKFEAKHESLREAGNAYTFATKRTEDAIARESLAKSMMLEPLRLQAESVGDVIQAQQLSNQQSQLRNAYKVQMFQFEHQHRMDMLQAAHLQMSLMMPYMRANMTPLPEKARSDFNAKLDSINTLSQSYQELNDTGLTPASMTPYTNAAEQRALRLAANETGTPSPSKEAIAAQHALIVPATFGTKGGALKNIRTATAQKYAEALRQLDELSNLSRGDRSEIEALKAQLQQTLKGAHPDILNEVLRRGAASSPQASERASRRQED